MRQMLDEGVSYNEVGRTLGVSPGTVSRRFPGFAWSKADAGRLGMFNRYAEAQIKKVWYGRA